MPNRRPAPSRPCPSRAGRRRIRPIRPTRPIRSMLRAPPVGERPHSPPPRPRPERPGERETCPVLPPSVRRPRPPPPGGGGGPPRRARLALGLDDDASGPSVTSLDADPVRGNQDSEPDEPLSQAADAVLPSVVSITFEADLGTGQGSGVIISDDGQILTNNHVAAEAADGGELSVTFSDGTRADAEVLGRDPATDLAVIQAQDVDRLTPATLGSSSDLHVGDTVLASGTPLGLDGWVGAGIGGALARSIALSNAKQPPFGEDGETEPAPSAVIDAIQTDAAINPGNSGGALINADGEVVGINTAIASLAGGGGIGSQGGNIGVGFAIPIDSARQIAEQLIEDGEVTHAYLGVRIADAESGGGAIIGEAEEGQPAAEGGLKEGDVITRVDDREITTGSELTAAIRSHQPGDRVTITYTRDGDERTTEVTLGELPTD